VKTCADAGAVQVMTRRIFDFIDKNKDGLLDTEELLLFMTNMAT
jgi:Ca2+-binding EF-hand superfamily protein